MSNSIGIGKRNMINSSGFGKPKMNQKALSYIDIFKGRNYLNITQKSGYYLELAHFSQAKKTLEHLGFARFFR